MELSENTRMNEYVIKLKKDKQLLFSPIYSLRLVELETLKTYIKINLASNFIWPFNFLIGIPIFFDKKLDRSFCLCVNY